MYVELRNLKRNRALVRKVMINMLDSLSGFCDLRKSMKRIEFLDKVDEMVRFLGFYKKFLFSEIVCKIKLLCLIWCRVKDRGFLKFNQVHNCCIACSRNDDFCWSKFFDFFCPGKVAEDFDIVFWVVMIIVFLFGISEDENFFSGKEFWLINECLDKIISMFD